MIIYLLVMQFDVVLRQALRCLSAVSETTAFITYFPGVGIVWIARGDNDRLPVVLILEEESYELTTVSLLGPQQPLLIILTFNIAELYAMVRFIVPAGCELHFYIDPDTSEFQINLRTQGGVLLQTIECYEAAPHQIGPGWFPAILGNQGIVFEIPNDLMRSALGYSQRQETAIALISWGHLWMICCGDRKEIYCQDVVPAGYQPPYVCYHISFHLDHQNTWINRAFRLTDRVLIRGAPPLACFAMNDSMNFYLVMDWDSFVQPQVLP